MKTKKTMKYITSLVLVLVLGLGMASTAFAASNIYYDKALSIAVAKAGITYTSIEEQSVELKSKKNYYEVELETVNGVEYEYKINATTGAIISSKISGRSKGATDTSYIGTDKAMSIAQAKSGISTSSITEQEVELTTSKRVYVYKVEFETARGKEAEYTINASTGAIISSKIK